MEKTKAASALTVLALEDVTAQDRLYVVLREEFINAAILHEFACQCAEKALALIENPDPRSVAAIAAKRAWLRGEIGNEQLTDARNAAYDVVLESTGHYAAWHAAWAAAWDNGRTAAWRASEVAYENGITQAEQVELLVEILTAA